MGGRGLDVSSSGQAQLAVLENVGNFLTSSTTTSFSRRTQLRGVSYILGLRNIINNNYYYYY
jgi:hypothetical protein